MSLMPFCELLQTEQRSRSVSFWDPSSGARIEAHTPGDRPDLWRRYVEGLQESYREHGVEAALDLASFGSGESTSLFFVALDMHDDVIGGTRMHGPLSDVGQARALVELCANPEGVAIARRLIKGWLPFGVIEMKGGWVHREARNRRALADTISRCFLHAMALLDAEFAFGTGSTHVVRCWSSTGAKIVDSIESTPYPDDRYQTRLMWWDRSSIGDNADPAQLHHFRREIEALRRPRPTRLIPTVPLPRCGT